jgi:hypothetical protein
MTTTREVVLVRQRITKVASEEEEEEEEGGEWRRLALTERAEQVFGLRLVDPARHGKVLGTLAQAWEREAAKVEDLI